MKTTTVSLAPTLQSLNVHSSKILLPQPLLVQSNSNLIVVNQREYSTAVPRRVINVAYIEYCAVFLILCQDFALYVYTEKLQFISKLQQWDSKYSVGMYFIKEPPSILLVGINEILLQKIHIHTNRPQSRFLTSTYFAIEKQESYMIDETTKPSWIKGCSINNYNKDIVVWSLQDINIYQFPILKTKTTLKNITQKHIFITTVVELKNYLLSGHSDGSIKVWRLKSSYESVRLLPTQQISLVHTWHKHTKIIEGIIPKQDLVLSYSQQILLCEWSLQSFQLLRIVDLSQQLNSIIMINFNSGYGIHNSQVYKVTLGIRSEFLTQINSNIIYCERSSSGESLQLTLSSNSGILIPNNSIKQSLFHSSNFYPPLKAQSIKQIIASPHQHNKYFMLVEGGDLYRVRIENSSSKIEERFKVQKVLDLQNKPVGLIPTLICFCPFITPLFDSQMGSSLNCQTNLQLITVGCERGVVLFIQLPRVDRVQTRFNYHRDSIVDVQFMNHQIVVTQCAQKVLKLTQIRERSVNCYFSIDCKSFSLVKSCDSVLGVVFKERQLKFFTCIDNVLMGNRRECLHEEDIINLDYHPSNKLVVTSAIDQTIRIWSLSYKLLFKITLDQGLQSVYFLNPTSILICQHLRLFLLNDLSLQHNDREQYQNQDEQLLPITYFITQFTQQRTVSEIDTVSQKVYKQHVCAPQLLVKRRRNLSQQDQRLRVQKQRQKQKEKDQRLKATMDHIKQMKQIKKSLNNSLLPRIGPPQKNRLQEFMKEKLNGKREFFRRDITINRLILKNLMKEQGIEFKEQEEILRLDF